MRLGGRGGSTISVLGCLHQLGGVTVSKPVVPALKSELSHVLALDDLTEPLVIQRLLRYAKEQPGAPAVCDLVDTWSFAELMGRAAAVARQISEGSALGPIVLLVDRSLDSVAGALGVLWAGSMLIPVDAGEPTDRIREVAGRCGTTRVVDATARPRPLLTGLHVEPITRDTIGLSHWPEPTMRRGDTPMLVLFTSGSTGRAKGVLRTLDDLNELVILGERSQKLYFPCRTAVFMPINWLGGLNAGVFGLSSGRFTVFVDPTESSTNDLLARLTRLGVEQLMMPASLLRAISTNRGSGSASSTVRRLVTMGDALYWADVEAAAACFGPDVSVTTMYGATEGNGMFGINTVSTTGPFGIGLLPIGCPAPTLTVRLDFDNVTDEQREAAIGELIFRDALSAGYLDDAELNERRFGIDLDGVRIWRSGDLVQVDAEGGDPPSRSHRRHGEDQWQVGGASRARAGVAEYPRCGERGRPAPPVAVGPSPTRGTRGGRSRLVGLRPADGATPRASRSSGAGPAGAPFGTSSHRSGQGGSGSARDGVAPTWTWGHSGTG
ncbi:MAG: AMP-binding protein [Actinobacteria bacterium]|nr:AMP-binding protein [Actinomycetota bacterium]